MSRARVLWPVAAVASVALALAGGQPASVVARASGFALAIASLVVLTGWSGQLNLHVAAIGVGWGAYAAVALASAGVPSLVALIIAPVVVVPAALVIGVIAVRFRGLELAIATLAAGLAFEQMAFQNLAKWIGRGTVGTQFESSVVQIARPAGFAGDASYAVLAIVVAGGWLLAAAAFGRGRSGRILRAIRDREVVAEARGVPVFGWRVAAFVASIALAAAGGALLAGQTGAVTPEAFGLTLSLQLLAVATLAGIGRLDAAIVGAALVLLAQEAGGVPVLNLIAGDRIDLVFGAGLLVALWWRSRARATVSLPVAEPDHAPVALADRRARPIAAPVALRVEDVSVTFGSTRVLDGVALTVHRGEVVGLVGGNGAGKTTLFNCITGLVTPDRGRVFLADADITDTVPHRRAQQGLARTFQAVQLFDGLTVEEGMLVALRGRPRARVREALAEVGVDHIADRSPRALGFATLRLVELATAIASDPRVVLLDEPLAGLDAAERSVVLEAVRRLADAGRGVLLVEHDRAAVDRVADRTYVLASGRAAPAAKPSVVRPGRAHAARRKGGRVAARA